MEILPSSELEDLSSSKLEDLSSSEIEDLSLNWKFYPALNLIVCLALN
jgi:hypothetical protein